MPDSDHLSTAEAAAVLQVSDQTLRRWADERKVRHIRLPSGMLRFRRSDVEALLEPVEPNEAAS